MVTAESLVWMYLREIRLDGRETFVAGTLATLKEGVGSGEITSTSRGARSVTYRLSPVALEARLSAAYIALEHYDNGTEPGSRSVLMDWSANITSL